MILRVAMMPTIDALSLSAARLRYSETYFQLGERTARHMPSWRAVELALVIRIGSY